MPPRGFRRTHFPLFKADVWDFKRFVDQVCCYSIGVETSYDTLEFARRKPVLDDIAYALEYDVVQGRVNLNVAPHEGGAPIPVQFLVEKSFWENHEAVDEIKKFLSQSGNIIPTEYFFLFVENQKFYLEDIYNIAAPEKHKLLISEPRKLFDRLFEFDPLPTEEWFKRYGKYRQDFTWELIAVAWRYIAVLPHGEKFSVSNLASHLEDYLEKEELDPKALPKSSKIYQIAKNVADQRNRSDAQSAVGVSTNPKRPQMTAANRKRLKSPRC